MPSKLVIDREKSANAVIAAIRTHGPRAAEAVGRVAADVRRDDEPVPDVGLLLELCMRALERSMQAVTAADAANAAELADDAEPRDRRDERAATLNADLVELKEVATGLLGRPVLDTLQLDGSLPRDALALARHAEAVAERLRTATLPESRVHGATFHAEDWADRLAESSAALTEALSVVAHEAREAEATLVAKQRAIDEHDRTFGDVATLVSALLRIGGEPELAARVRPSARRPGRTVALAAGDDASTDEPTEPLLEG